MSTACCQLNKMLERRAASVCPLPYTPYCTFRPQIIKAEEIAPWETWGMNSRKTRVPKNGDRVTARGEQGKFVIYGVDVDLQTVELKLVDGGHDLKLSTIPWDALTFIDKQ